MINFLRVKASRRTLGNPSNIEDNINASAFFKYGKGFFLKLIIFTELLRLFLLIKSKRIFLFLPFPIIKSLNL